MSITLTVRADENGEIHLKHPLLLPDKEVRITLEAESERPESLGDFIERLRQDAPLPARTIDDIDAQIRWMRAIEE
jgi:hypothetical protein